MFKQVLLFSLLCLVGLQACEVEQSEAPATDQNLVDLVYPHLDAANSRWFFFSSACRPFGMVTLNPDTQIGGAWGSGYRYHTDTIKGFSHIHAWQLSGLSVMPVTYEVGKEQAIMTDYFSSFQHEKEKVAPGFHQLSLDRYGIGVQLTSTKRVGFHQYNFPAASERGIVFNLGGLLGPSEITGGKLEKVNDKTLVGELVNAPTRRRPKDAKVFFYITLNQNIGEVIAGAEGKFIVQLTEKTEAPLLMKAAISYTSVANAQLNLAQELPDWDFAAIVADSRAEWNGYLNRIQVKGGSETDQRRFYTDLWHALQGRRTISDVNGAYPDNTGADFRIGQLPLKADGSPAFNHYNSDSFWGAQWTLNTLWGLAYPEIYEEFVNSLLIYYQDGGFVPRGPSGGNYTHVMTGASSTPFMVSAFQKGIKGFDIEMAYEGMKKNHMPGGTMARAGYEHATLLGGGLTHYITNGYVPYPIPEGKFGFHQDGASLTLEYAYQDWTLAQMAKALGKQEDFAYFTERSKHYQNLFDKESGWIRPKSIEGKWLDPFDPYLYEHGFNESNGAQSHWFVPQDLKGLAALMGGEEAAATQLNAQFEEARKLGFTSGSSHALETHPEYRRIPINYGNQPSIQTAFIFNHLGRPDLTQYWSRQVATTAYGGLNPDTGYNGDEDQGLMGALAVLMKIGLFQMTGGTEEDPVYELASPIFDHISIRLHPDYYPGGRFEIAVLNNGPDHPFLQSANLNGKPIQGYSFPHSALVKGGKLELVMGASAR